MKKLSVTAILFVLTAMTGCASVKDENGKVVGSCFGAPCFLRSLVGDNVIDPKTGVTKGDIPLFKIGGAKATSATPQTTTMADQNNNEPTPQTTAK